jgi:hypothetical protein
MCAFCLAQNTAQMTILCQFHSRVVLFFKMALVCENIAQQHSKPPKTNRTRLLFRFAVVGASFVAFYRHFYAISCHCR